MTNKNFEGTLTKTQENLLVLTVMLGCFVSVLNMTNINTQLLTIEAARTRKKEDILRAVMLEPRCAAILSIDDMQKMVEELLEAHGPYMAMYH